MAKEPKLKIEYESEIDEEEMDKALEKLLKRFGWDFEGSGYEFKTKIRDLSFYRKMK